MFSATRVAAVVAVLALSGSMVIYSGAFDRATYQGAAPPASAEDMIAAVATFEHTTMPNVRDFGEATEEGGIGHLRGRVITSVHEDEHDPRLSGTAIFTVDAVDFGGRGPEWGTFRLENDEGAWQGTLTGYHAGNTTRLSGWLVGEGAYEGLSQYREMEHTGLGATMFRGIIVPGAPPIEARFPD